MKIYKMLIIGFISLFQIGIFAENTTTFKDIVPILRKRCIECHRPGESTPIAFDSYESVKLWAKSIIKEIDEKRMPPWFADIEYGFFVNENTITSEETEKIKKWVNQGSLKGNFSGDLLSGFKKDWKIGKPDIIFEISPEFIVPTEGFFKYKYFRIPTNFEEDKWVSAIEIKPGNKKIVHHIIAFVVPKGGFPIKGALVQGMIGEYAPGIQPNNFLDESIGIKIPRESDIIVQVHYISSKEQGHDSSQIAMVFCKEKPRNIHISEAIPNSSIVIPAGHSDFYIKSTKKFDEDTQLVSLTPHIDNSCKSFKYTLLRSDGTLEILLNVEKYDHDWQIKYVFKNPLYVRRGDFIICESRFDNSYDAIKNPYPKDIEFKGGSWDEIMIGWISKIKINDEYEDMPLAYEKQSFKIDALVAEQKNLLDKVIQNQVNKFSE